MLAVLRREMSNYFTSPIGYIFLAVFYFFSGMFFANVLAYNSTDITNVFSGLFTVLMFIIPLLTMRSMSEEKKQKTDQLLDESRDGAQHGSYSVRDEGASAR